MNYVKAVLAYLLRAVGLPAMANEVFPNVPTVADAVEGLHKAVAKLEDTVVHHSAASAAADRAIAAAAAAKLTAEQEVAKAKKVGENIKNLLGL